MEGLETGTDAVPDGFPTLGASWCNVFEPAAIPSFATGSVVLGASSRKLAHSELGGDGVKRVGDGLDEDIDEHGLETTRADREEWRRDGGRVCVLEVLSDDQRVANATTSAGIIDHGEAVERLSVPVLAARDGKYLVKLSNVRVLDPDCAVVQSLQVENEPDTTRQYW